MSQFDIFENPNARSQPNVPLILTIQSDHFSNARTTVVIPLVRRWTPDVTTALNPTFEVNGESVTLDPFQIAFLPRIMLGARVGSLEIERPRIIRAVDALLSGL